MKKSNIQSWLDQLQQESWQLELIISSILLLIIGSYDDTIYDLILKYQNNQGFNFAYIVAILVPILLFIKSNLIAHIFLRGLWIGCIGLRSVSSKVDYDSFGYASKFDTFLKRKIIPFDNYIEQLERICSIIFSYSFLMVFHFLSFSIFFTIVQSLNYFGWQFANGTIAELLLGIVSFVLVLSGVLNFIDFVTIGKLKQAKRFSSVFYPFYRIYNFFSLAFLYRSIHYNFISNKLGRSYMLLMLPYIFLLAFAGNKMSFSKYVYIPKKENGSGWALEKNYDTLRENAIIEQASIEKLFYQNNEPIKLFLRLDDGEKTNKLIKHLCPDITSYNRQPYSMSIFNTLTITANDGYHSTVSSAEHNRKVEASLSCIADIYEVYIDSTLLEGVDYVFYQHPNLGENGLLTGININTIETGKHTLTVKVKTLDKDSIKTGSLIKIPFFKN